MEVIFIKDLRGQGKKGDIKDVKTGYAENYLIKNGYAVLKTKDSLRQLEKENKEKKAKDLEEQEKAKELKKLIDKEVLEFQVKTGAGDRVFGSISLKQIKDELLKQGYKIEKSQIEIPNIIQSLGFHNVNINLYPGITAQVKVHVIK